MPDHASSGHVRELINHWYWRPGWKPGRQFYTWHLTFEAQKELHDLVSECQQVLRDLPELDMVPRSWLHITIQGVGFVDEVPITDVKTIGEMVGARLADIPALNLTFHELSVQPQAIVLYPVQQGALHVVRECIRKGISDVWEDVRVPEGGVKFTPHLSVAYVNMNVSSNRTLSVLSRIAPASVEITTEKVSLIRLERVGHTYEWTSVIDASLKPKRS